MAGRGRNTSKVTEDIMARAGRVFSRAYVDSLRSKGHDMVELQGEGSYLKDAQGRRYIDCLSGGGMFNLGRRNQALALCLKKALHETDQGNFVMPSDYKALLAARLAEFVPGSLECVLFGVTRGESMDAACKLARGFTARKTLVAADGGCHGETGFALSVSARQGKEQFGGLIPCVETVPFGDVDAAASRIGDQTAAFVMEPIQAENHARTAPGEYFGKIREICDRHGVVLVFDETQTGFGRTGTRFYFEQTGVEPDILVIGEAITSGMFPMTAMVFTRRLKRFFDEHPLIHLCTFGGHDLGCVVAMRALEEYDALEPWENARRLGEVLLAGLGDAVSAHGGRASVTGAGLLASVRFGGPDEARTFCVEAARAGLLVDVGRVDASSVVFRPSLLVSEQEVNEIVRTAEDVIRGM